MGICNRRTTQSGGMPGRPNRSRRASVYSLDHDALRAATGGTGQDAPARSGAGRNGRAGRGSGRTVRGRSTGDESRRLPPGRASRCRPRCGSLTVYEDRAAGDGRTIDLKIVVIPGRLRQPRAGFRSSSSPAAPARPQRSWRTDAAVARRRTPEPRPGLRRSARHRRLGTDERARSSTTRWTSRRSASRCRSTPSTSTSCGDAWRKSRPLPTRASTTTTRRDGRPRRRARRALGYDTINLYGGSYGTRAGLVYMRRHPERVRTAVLDGLAPVAIALPSTVNADAHRALDLLFADCAADAACDAAFPDLRQTFARVIAALEASPRRLDTIHPRTGEPFESTLTAASFAGVLPRRALQPDFREPGAVHRRARRRGRLRPVTWPRCSP